MANVFRSICSLSRWIIFNPSVSGKRLFTGSASLSSTIRETEQPRIGQKERPSNESLIKWKKLPVPKDPPKDRWIHKKALFGENDYKDLLGDGSYPLSKNVKKGPFWLRGWRGNEFQRLIRKKKFMGDDMGPKAKHAMNKRIKYMYRKMNRNLGNKFAYSKT